MKSNWIVTAVLAASLTLTGCSSAAATQAPVAGTEAAQPSAVGSTQAPETRSAATQATVTSAAWVADGVISDGEYPHQTSIVGVDIYWRNDAEYLYLAASTKTTAWIAVGLEPDDRMMGANIIIGAVVDGKAVIDDQYGTAPTAHDADTTLGGKNDIVKSAASLADNIMLWEVQIPLDSGDQYDKTLTAGQSVHVIVATGSSSSFSSPHSSRGSGQIKLD
ncbi:MAG: hypothetical protein LLG44_08510 [Chloroflexi bacterium]|nr:hypothetical protein [Chloroflexota bacterium]